MDWSENIVCIKCDGDVNLLVCSDNDCPLAIHKGCMGCPARYDDAGRFYCPYCWYKQAVAESRHTMEYALSRKRALMIFMDEVTAKGAEESRHVQLEDSDENANGMRCDYGKNRQGGDALTKHIQLTARDENVNITAGGDSKRRRNVANIHHDGEQEISGAEEETILDEESEASARSNGQNPMQGENNISNTVEKIQGEDLEGFSDHKGRDPSLELSNIEENLVQEQKLATVAACDQNPSLVVYEEENILEEGLATLSASTGEDSLQTVPLKGTAYRGSRIVRFKSKGPKLSDENEQNSPTVPSSRRISSTMRKLYVSSGKVDGSGRHSCS